jgi:hypothetical protein
MSGYLLSKGFENRKISLQEQLSLFGLLVEKWLSPVKKGKTKNSPVIPTHKRGLGSPIKGLVKKKTPPPNKKRNFFFDNSVVVSLGLDLLLILLRARYFRLWFTWPLTRISHPSESKPLCLIRLNTAPSAFADQRFISAMPVPIVYLQIMWFCTNPFVAAGIGESK